MFLWQIFEAFRNWYYGKTPTKDEKAKSSGCPMMANADKKVDEVTDEKKKESVS